MNKKLKKVLTFGFDTRLFAVAAFIGLIVMLVPLYRLCAYAIPFFDDYYAAWRPRLEMASLPGVRGLLKGALEDTASAWHTWSGTFVTKFLMALSPLDFGEDYYVLGPIFLITILVIGSFVFTGVCVRDLFHASWDVILGLQSLTTTLIVLFLESPQQGFYWFNGGVNYIFSHAVWLMALGCTVHLFCTPKKKTRIAMMILGSFLLFLVGGGNLITALQAGVLSFMLLVLIVLTAKKKACYLLPQTIAYAIAMGVNVAAPGNAVRGAMFASSRLSAGAAILRSFTEGARFFHRFTDYRTLLFLLLFIPFIWKMTRGSKHTLISWKFYPLVLCASAGLYVCGFTPPLYATGAVDLARVYNVLKITFQLLLLVNGIYLACCLQKTLASEKTASRPVVATLSRWEGRVFWLLIPLWILVWNYHLRIQPNPIGTYSSWGAAYYLRTGKAGKLKEEYQERIATIHDSGQDVVVEPYTELPWFLGWQELSTDPDAEQNRAMATFYWKNSIRVRE